MSQVLDYTKSTTSEPRQSMADVKAVAEAVESQRNIFQRIIFYFKAKVELKKTLQAIDQAEQIRQGKKPAKSFEQSIREL